MMVMIEQTDKNVARVRLSRGNLPCYGRFSLDRVPLNTNVILDFQDEPDYKVFNYWIGGVKF